MGLTWRAKLLNVIAIVCFFIWFYTQCITLRKELDGWMLLIFLGAPSMVMRLIPLIFICPVVRSKEYEEFWEISKLAHVQTLTDGDHDTNDLIDSEDYLHQQQLAFTRKYVLAGLVAFIYAWAFFSMINESTTLSFIAILSFTLEGFCVAELLKVGPTSELVTEGAGRGSTNFGFFPCVVGNSVCTAQKLYGFESRNTWVAFAFCILLVLLHTLCCKSNYYYSEDDESEKTSSLFTNLIQLNNKVTDCSL